MQTNHVTFTTTTFTLIEREAISIFALFCPHHSYAAVSFKVVCELNRRERHLKIRERESKVFSIGCHFARTLTDLKAPVLPFLTLGDVHYYSVLYGSVL